MVLLPLWRHKKLPRFSFLDKVRAHCGCIYMQVQGNLAILKLHKEVKSYVNYS